MGRDQGKERLACLVAAMESSASPRFVAILPITHVRPTKENRAVNGHSMIRRVGHGLFGRLGVTEL
jgi:hypothetical protein